MEKQFNRPRHADWTYRYYPLELVELVVDDDDGEAEEVLEKDEFGTDEEEGKVKKEQIGGESEEEEGTAEEFQEWATFF